MTTSTDPSRPAALRADMLNRLATDLTTLQDTPPPWWRIHRRRRWKALVARGHAHLHGDDQ